MISDLHRTIYPHPDGADPPAPSRRSGLVPDHAELFELLAERLGVSGLNIRWSRSSSPGGDPLNMAHVHAEDDLRAFVIEHDLPEQLDMDARRAVIHELLHVALRHVASVARHATDPAVKAWLTQAIEEDTEALAEALERWIDR